MKAGENDVFFLACESIPMFRSSLIEERYGLEVYQTFDEGTELKEYGHGPMGEKTKMEVEFRIKYASFLKCRRRVW